MNQATLEKMKFLKLYGMHRAFASTMEIGSVSYTNDELIAYLIDAEFDDKESRKIERLINTAKFRYRAFMEEVMVSTTRNIDKNTIGRLSSCDFIKQKQNILVTGSTGVGKVLLLLLLVIRLVWMDIKSCILILISSSLNSKWQKGMVLI